MAFKVGAIVSKLTLDKSDWNKSVKKVGEDQKKMQGMSKKTAKQFKKAGKAMTVAGAAIVGALGAMVKAYEKQAIAEKQLETVLRSTGHAAGLTKDQLLEMAAALQDVTTYGDETIIGAQNLLLTFTKIGKEVFPEALEIVLDMSTALGQDLKSSAIQVGKALNDPIKGMTALSRVGVSFTEDQIKMVKQMVETGNALDAQKFILAELTTEFGGSARAAAETFTGQLKQLKNDAGDLAEKIGSKLVPILSDMVAKIKPVVQKIMEWVDENPKLVETIVKIAGGVGALMLVLGPLAIMLPGLSIAFAALTGPIGLVITALGLLGAAALKAGRDFKISMKMYQAEMDITGRKTSWLERTMGSISAVWQKYTYGIDTTKMALEGYNEKMRQADGIMNIVKGTSFVLKDGIGFLKDKFVELTNAMENTDDEGGRVDTTIRKLATGVGITTEKANELMREWERLVDVLDLEVFGELVDVIEEGDIWLANLATEAEETGGVMESVFENIGLDYKALTEGVEGDTETTTKEVKSKWLEASERIKDAWTRELGEMLAGTKSFKEGLDAIWGEIKRMFFDMVAQMVTKWVFGFVQKMITSTATAATSVTSQLQKTGTDIIKKVGSWSPGGVVGSVITGAVSGLISGLITGSKMKQQNKFLQEISENTWNTKNLLMTDYKIEVHTTQNLLRDIFHKVESLNPKTDATNRILRKIEKYVKPIKDMVSAQGGAIVTKPTLAVLHGSQSDPEIASPVSKLLEGLRGFGGGASASLSQAINIVINVKDQLDPYTAQNIVRKQVVPIMLDAIELDSKNKTKMRQILGVQV